MLEQIILLATNPLLWKVLIGYWAFSAIVDKLPEPKSSELYKFIYGVLHGFAGNIQRFIETVKGFVSQWFSRKKDCE